MKSDAKRGRWTLAWMLLVVVLGTAVAEVGHAQESAVPETGRDARLGAARAAYERGDFSSAAENWSAVVQEGLDHPLVHYNLGNAYFKDGKLGEAIASYVRAHRLAPRNADIATNLSRARSQIRDRELDASRNPAVLRVFTAVYHFLSLNEWWTLALVTYVLALASHAGSSWWPSRRMRLRQLALTASVFALIAGAMGAVRYQHEVTRSSAVAVAEEIEVRSGPGRDYPLAFRIHEGLQVHVAESRDNWVRIDLGGELTGWVPATSLVTL